MLTAWHWAEEHVLAVVMIGWNVIKRTPSILDDKRCWLQHILPCKLPLTMASTRALLHVQGGRIYDSKTGTTCHQASRMQRLGDADPLACASTSESVGHSTTIYVMCSLSCSDCAAFAYSADRRL